MTDTAPERIWVDPPYFTLHGTIPNIVWEPHWNTIKGVQSFAEWRSTATEYVRADLCREAQMQSISDGCQMQEAVEAAYRRGLEDAAKVAAEWFYTIPDAEKADHSGQYYDGMEVATIRIAATIRALQEKAE